MEERESLTRQIELLQNLINTHKSIHGDAPSGPGGWRAPTAAPVRGRGLPFSSTFPPCSGLHGPRPSAQWRKYYSLSNRSTVSSATPDLCRERPLQARPSLKQVSLPACRTDLPGNSSLLVPRNRGTISCLPKGESPGTAAASILGQTGSEVMGRVSRATASMRGAGVSTQGGARTAGDSTMVIQQLKMSTGSRANPASRKATAGAFPTIPLSCPPPQKPDSSVKLVEKGMHPSRTGSTPLPSLPPSLSAQTQDISIPEGAPRKNANASSRVCLLAAAQKRSQFTWVKSSAPQPVLSSPRDAGCGAVALERKVAHRPGLSLTTKYTWVSCAVSRHGRLSRRPSSPKVPDPSQKKTKPRRAVGASPSPQSSRYRWKASGVTAKGTALSGSVYRWTSEREKGPRGAVSPRLTPQATGFKLKSRMKIIRGRPSSSSLGSGSERRPGFSSPTVSSRYSLRQRPPARGLISIGRHKLRRLSSANSPGSSRAGPSSPVLRGSTAQRVIRTRYKIVTRRGFPGPSSASFSSPSLSWRARKVQCARNLLQSRLRSPPGAPPDEGVLAHPWRGRNVRWIGGALYRVSANKLYRTASPSASAAAAVRLRAGKCSTPQDPAAHRASSTRHLASRAVQRSRSIIRHALQRRQQSKQYCMYYNRFGRCNRGQNCPYIHDPDKVAVCTRFLRGTCKQTDGTCPFSHKVSKEKMPVCSYFLRGVCSNSSCPYSHVYVSRKAAICEDFVRGYCPQGEKCKKKHTLLCPDFSSAAGCPRGSRCHLQHRSRTKRVAPRHSSMPAKRARKHSSPDRQESVEGTAPQDRTPPGPSRLPSFISLCSSPEGTEALDTPPAGGPQVTAPEKKLHIKPRF
ncbi:zinc finger CCCH domain-containing protein 3 isoform X1 [Scleropages formosus]|uniref:zinc finger CCCH domain-containing protein 3 isoform X1 n=1 Tax=Scleropages formosus TaxID=113540 RepID=UPI0010FA84B0|nr:zinc finger CCCH domain-containing protein 3 isoform X1 [Scleropages formosus]